MSDRTGDPIITGPLTPEQKEAAERLLRDRRNETGQTPPGQAKPDTPPSAEEKVLPKATIGRADGPTHRSAQTVDEVFNHQNPVRDPVDELGALFQRTRDPKLRSELHQQLVNLGQQFFRRYGAPASLVGPSNLLLEELKKGVRGEYRFHNDSVAISTARSIPAETAQPGRVTEHELLHRLLKLKRTICEAADPEGYKECVLDEVCDYVGKGGKRINRSRDLLERWLGKEGDCFFEQRFSDLAGTPIDMSVTPEEVQYMRRHIKDYCMEQPGPPKAPSENKLRAWLEERTGEKPEPRIVREMVRELNHIEYVYESSIIPKSHWGATTWLGKAKYPELKAYIETERDSLCARLDRDPLRTRSVKDSPDVQRLVLGLSRNTNSLIDKSGEYYVLDVEEVRCRRREITRDLRTINDQIDRLTHRKEVNQIYKEIEQLGHQHEIASLKRDVVELSKDRERNQKDIRTREERIELLEKDSSNNTGEIKKRLERMAELLADRQKNAQEIERLRKSMDPYKDAVKYCNAVEFMARDWRELQRTKDGPEKTLAQEHLNASVESLIQLTPETHRAVVARHLLDHKLATPGSLLNRASPERVGEFAETLRTEHKLGFKQLFDGVNYDKVKLACEHFIAKGADPTSLIEFAPPGRGAAAAEAAMRGPDAKSLDWVLKHCGSSDKAAEIASHLVSRGVVRIADLKAAIETAPEPYQAAMRASVAFVERKQAEAELQARQLFKDVLAGGDGAARPDNALAAERRAAERVIKAYANPDSERPALNLENVNDRTLRLKLEKPIAIPTDQGSKTVVAVCMSTDGILSYELNSGVRDPDLAKAHFASIQQELNTYQAQPAELESMQQLKDRLAGPLPANPTELRDRLRERGELLTAFAQQLADAPKPAAASEGAPPPAQSPPKADLTVQPANVTPKTDAVAIRGKGGHVEEVQHPQTGESRMRLVARDLSKDELIRVIEEQLKSLPEGDKARKPMAESLANLQSAVRNTRELETLKLNRQLRDQGFEWTTDASGKPNKVYRQGALVAEIHPAQDGHKGPKQPLAEGARRIGLKEAGGAAVTGLMFYLMFRPSDKQPLQLVYE